MTNQTIKENLLSILTEYNKLSGTSDTNSNLAVKTVALAIKAIDAYEMFGDGELDKCAE